MTPDAYRIAGKMDRLDRQQFRRPVVPPANSEASGTAGVPFDSGTATHRHGIERYEHHGCRCDVCTAAHVRVEQLALRLDNELRRLWGVG